MTQAHKTPGNWVKLKPEAHEPGHFYYPHCNEYQGHAFEVLDVPYPGHVLMRSVSGLKDPKDATKPLEIMLHDDSIQTLSKQEKLGFK